MTTRTSLNQAANMVTIVRSSIPMRAGVPLKADQLKVPVVVDLGPTTRTTETTGALPKCTLTPTDPAATSTTTSKRRKTRMTTRTEQGQEGAVGEAIVASHCKAQHGTTLTATGSQKGLTGPTLTRTNPNSSATILTNRACAMTSKALGASIRSRTWVEDAVARAKQPQETKVAIVAGTRATLCLLVARMEISSPLSTRKMAKLRKLS